MPVSISKLLIKNKKLIVLESLLLLLVPCLWSFGGKVLDSQTKIEISELLLVQLITTLSILSIALFVACLTISEEFKKYDSNIQYRRNLINKWRKMVKEITDNLDENEEIKVSTLLERQEDYYSLRPNLSQDTIKEIARTRKYIMGSTIHSTLRLILDDIDQIEKNWNLV